MGSTFTLYADFNLIDGGSTSTKNVTIGTNTQVIGDGGVIFDNATVALVDGVLQVELPDNTNDPFDFGYTVRRATGLTKTWRVPVQEPGVRVLLTTFTSTTPLPLPPSGNAVSQTDFTAYQAEAEAALADETTRATDSEALLAPKASPALTGTPTAPTATPATNSTRIATTAYTDAAVAVEASARTSAITAAVTTAVNNLLAGTPGALDTLKELADALGDDPSFATTITNLIAAKVPQSRTLAGLDLSANRSAQELVDALGSVFSASIDARMGRVFTPEQFGTCPGDTTDVSTYVLAAVTAAQAAGGGTVMLQPGKNYQLNSCLANPYTGTTTPLSKPVRITSRGAGSANGRWPTNAKNGGATLDLRYDGTDTLHPAKIDTRGAGMLEIDHLNLVSGGTDNLPLFQTTNTAIHAHHNFIQGNTANSGSSCVQDAFILGGTGITIDNGANAPFQGYGSKIHDNFFDHIRVGVLGRAYCNSVPVENNTFSTSCGNDGSVRLGGAIEFTGNSTAGFCVGNQTRGNTIECVHYKYGVALTWAANNVIGPDGYWDPAGPYVAGVYCAPSAQFNRIEAGYYNDAFPGFVEDASVAGSNDFRTSHQSQTSYMTAPWKFTNTGNGLEAAGVFKISGGGSKFYIQPAAAQASNANELIRGRRSTLEGTDPGADFFTVTQGAQVTLSGVNAALLLRAQDGTPRSGVYQGSGSPEGVQTAPVSSLYLRVNGSLSTLLYVKVTGTGNTGWVACAYLPGGTDVAVVDGGTGASDAATARTNLGVDTAIATAVASAGTANADLTPFICVYADTGTFTVTGSWATVTGTRVPIATGQQAAVSGKTLQVRLVMSGLNFTSGDQFGMRFADDAVTTFVASTTVTAGSGEQWLTSSWDNCPASTSGWFVQVQNSTAARGLIRRVFMQFRYV